MPLGGFALVALPSHDGGFALVAVPSHDGGGQPVPCAFRLVCHADPTALGCRLRCVLGGKALPGTSSEAFADMVHGLDEAGCSSGDAALCEHHLGCLLGQAESQPVHLVCDKPSRRCSLRRLHTCGLHAPVRICREDASLVHWVFISCLEKFVTALIFIVPFYSHIDGLLSRIEDSIKLDTHPEFELVLVMVIFPALLNAIYAWIVDNIIKNHDTTSLDSGSRSAGSSFYSISAGMLSAHSLSAVSAEGRNLPTRSIP